MNDASFIVPIETNSRFNWETGNSGPRTGNPALSVFSIKRWFLKAMLSRSPAFLFKLQLPNLQIMCSIGWKKLKDGFLVFKNRDRYTHEDITNRIIEDESVIGFGDDTYPGMWFGINKKYHLAILTAWGPRSRTKKDEDNFQVVEEVLRSSISIYSAVEKFLDLANEKLKGSYNLIFCDSEKAAILEWTPQKHSIEYLGGMAVKTNDFVMLYDYNKDDAHVLRSAARRKNLEYIFPSHESPEEMKSMLAFHSAENELANVCRHDYAKTIGSVFAYVTADKIQLFYSLNRSPEERHYGEKIVKLR